ncbi:2984_t:CDS:1, partial [Ambispora gerdemannii]
HQKTNFTFVGDPKQNIMAFAGATDDIFQLLKERFADCAQMEISISFRVPEEIAAVANDFTRKFMPHKPKLTTNQTNGGKKPVVFLAGLEKGYHLTPSEESKIKERANQISEEEKEPEDKKIKKIPKLEKKLVAEKIKAKKLESQIKFILDKISKLEKSASRVILYRKNEI